MHTTTAPDGTIFQHNSDLSGNVTIVTPEGNLISVSGNALLFLVERRIGDAEMFCEELMKRAKKTVDGLAYATPGDTVAYARLLLDAVRASETSRQVNAALQDVLAAIAALPSGPRDPDVIDIFPAGTGHPMYPMGIQLVAIDAARTRWTIIDGRKRGKCNRIGAFYIASSAMSEDFVFTRAEAEAMVEKLVNPEPDPVNPEPDPATDSATDSATHAEAVLGARIAADGQ